MRRETRNSRTCGSNIGNQYHPSKHYESRYREQDSKGLLSFKKEKGPRSYCTGKQEKTRAGSRATLPGKRQPAAQKKVILPAQPKTQHTTKELNVLTLFRTKLRATTWGILGHTLWASNPPSRDLDHPSPSSENFLLFCAQGTRLTPVCQS